MVRFTHPEMFYLFIIFVLFLLWNLFRDRKLKKQLSLIATDQIRNFLFNRVIFNRVSLKNIIINLGALFLILSSVGPQIGTKLTELKREGIDVIIALDTSISMDAVDVTPSRMEKAKYELSRFINKLEGDRVGLIVFSGNAHLHCPMTLDYAAARLFLNTIDTDIVQSRGTDLASALTLALENIDEENKKYKLIILVSDGEDHEGKAIELANIASDEGIIIHTLGIGTSGGGPIPAIDNNGNQIYKKDISGEVITTALNESILDEIARITGGRYIRIENQPNAIGPLIEEIQNMEKRELKSHIFSQFEDRYRVFLILAVICLLAEFFISTRSGKEMIWKGRFSQ